MFGPQAHHRFSVQLLLYFLNNESKQSHEYKKGRNERYYDIFNEVEVVKRTEEKSQALKCWGNSAGPFLRERSYRKKWKK